MSDFDELSQLFSEARRANTAIPTKAAKKVEPHDPRRLFTAPENWKRTRGIALIHEETNSVLGNFSEYVHVKVVGARKLIREEAPISVSATERVSGSWWLGAERTPEPHRPWHEQKAAIIHLVLGELKVHSPATEVIVHLAYGAVARVELAVDTRLAQTEGGEQLLDLPEGMNVLEVMSLDCKLALRKEIGL